MFTITIQFLQTPDIMNAFCLSQNLLAIPGQYYNVKLSLCINYDLEMRTNIYSH
jgi:hypothetical protein